MNIKKAIVIILIIQAIVGTYFEIIYFNIPYWIADMRIPQIFDFTETLNILLNILSYILTFVGFIQIIKLKKIDIVNAFKFPIYFFIARNIAWFITTLFSNKHSFIFLPEQASWFSYILKALSLILIVLIFIHYLSKNKEEGIKSDITSVSKKSRFFNWIIDLSIIYILSINNIMRLSDNFIFEDVPFLNSSASWFILLIMFWYYFILELLFLQTIGKLHNNSVVLYEKNKFKSILFRTLGRFIPFESLSFFGKEGWHDTVSNTSVYKANAELENDNL